MSIKFQSRKNTIWKITACPVLAIVINIKILKIVKMHNEFLYINGFCQSLAVLTVCTLCLTLTFVLILMKFIVFNLQSYWCWKKLEPPWHIKTRMWKTDRKDNLICSDVPWVSHGLFNAVESAACCWVIKRIKLWQISYTYICQMWWCSSRSWS